jgi:hypothetical protein
MAINQPTFIMYLLVMVILSKKKYIYIDVHFNVDCNTLLQSAHRSWTTSTFIDLDKTNDSPGSFTSQNLM